VSSSRVHSSSSRASPSSMAANARSTPSPKGVARLSVKAAWPPASNSAHSPAQPGSPRSTSPHAGSCHVDSMTTAFRAGADDPRRTSTIAQRAQCTFARPRVVPTGVVISGCAPPTSRRDGGGSVRSGETSEEPVGAGANRTSRVLQLRHASGIERTRSEHVGDDAMASLASVQLCTLLTALGKVAGGDTYFSRLPHAARPCCCRAGLAFARQSAGETLSAIEVVELRLRSVVGGVTEEYACRYCHSRWPRGSHGMTARARCPGTTPTPAADSLGAHHDHA
jgi:hypothetical protein